MKVFAIIPARGGSKGIPGKNIKYLCGKPLIAYTIEAAKASKYIDKVFVSTDDKSIRMYADVYGAQSFRRRSKEISSDTASSESAILEWIEFNKPVFDNQPGLEPFPDVIVFLQCTSPLTTTEDIDGTIEALIDKKADTAFAGTPFYHFIWNKYGEGINHDKTYRQLRQNKPKQYLETGAVYVMKTDGFLKHKHRFFGKTVTYEMPKERVLEIDEPWDFELAEMIMRKNDSKDNS